MSDDYYSQKIIEVMENSGEEKGELLYKIIKVIEVLPIPECQRVYGYLNELYFS